MFESVRTSRIFKSKIIKPTDERWHSEFVSNNIKGWRLAAPKWATIRDDQLNLPVVFGIGSGKGGVGKSLISANLGAYLAEHGHRALVVDMDVGCANLHTYFGISHPPIDLDDFFEDEHLDFLKLIMPGPIKGLGIVAGGRNDERATTKLMTPKNLERLWQGIINCRDRYDIDFVILDLGAGTHPFTLELFTLSHIGLITVLPEPTSIENAYVFLKSYLVQLIRNIGNSIDENEHSEALADLLINLSAQHLDRGYLASIRSQYHLYPELIKSLGLAVMARKVGILVNQVREREDREIGRSMEDICRRFFGLQSHDIGYLNYDESAWRSLRNQRLLVSDFPHSLIVQRLSQSAQRLLSLAK